AVGRTLFPCAPFLRCSVCESVRSVSSAPSRRRQCANGGGCDMSAAACVVGVIADTHGLLRPSIADAFAGVHMILHAGDVGGRKILDALRAIARVEAVYGNVDDPHDPALARERTVAVGGLAIHVSHGHELGRPTPELALARYAADVV